MGLSYQIIQHDDTPLDGETYAHEQVLRAVQYMAPRDIIVAFDMAELRRDGRTSISVVTDDIIREAWDAGEVPPHGRVAQDHHLRGGYGEYMRSVR